MATSPPPLPAAVFERPAGFWRRWAAVMVDAILLWFPLSILQVWLGLPLFETEWEREATSSDAVIRMASLVVPWLYTALLDASRAQGTLGKQLLGIRVEDVHGGRLSFARASVRHLGSWLSLFTLCIGFLMNLWTKRRQTLHDMIAGAVVVRTEAPAASAPEVAV